VDAFAETQDGLVHQARLQPGRRGTAHGVNPNPGRPTPACEPPITVGGVSLDLTSHAAVSAVRSALAEQGYDPDFRVLPDAVKTAQAAADALGITPAEIANSLIFTAVAPDGSALPLLVMASGGHRVDTAYLAAALGLDRLDRATPDFVRTHTGMAIGGVAPLGHPAPIRTIVDTDLARFEHIWAAGGHSHTVFQTTFADLIEMTGGQVAEVAR